jgi:hypothetical protein
MNKKIISLSGASYVEELLLTILIVSLTSLLCLFFLFKSRKKYPFYKKFEIYVCSYFLLILIDFNPFDLPRPIHQSIFANADNLFTLLELIIYTLFFFPLFTVKQKRFSYMLIATYFIFFIFLTVLGNLHDRLMGFKNEIYVLQSLIIITYCVFYYINIFTDASGLILKKEATFWITTGVFCMLLGILPFSIAENYLMTSYRNSWIILSSIYNLLYTLNFIMLIKASLCKPTNLTL